MGRATPTKLQRLPHPFPPLPTSPAPSPRERTTHTHTQTNARHFSFPPEASDDTTTTPWNGWCDGGGGGAAGAALVGLLRIPLCAFVGHGVTWTSGGLTTLRAPHSYSLASGIT